MEADERGGREGLMNDDDWIWSGIMEPRMMLFLSFPLVHFALAAVNTGWHFHFLPRGKRFWWASLVSSLVPRCTGLAVELVATGSIGSDRKREGKRDGSNKPRL